MTDSATQPETRHPTPEARVLGHCPRCKYAVVDSARPCPECGLDAALLQSAIRNQQATIPFRPWLHRFALLFVAATFILLVLGGTVTSKGVGLAVPDWPTTFDHNMFLFPPSMWVGGIFWEHTHRLMGSLVGLLAIIMCIGLWQTNSNIDNDESPRTHVRGSAGTRPWLKWFGIATLIMVIAQGIMGGLRVTQLSITWAIVHGITAQVFLCMTVLIAAATSRWWVERAGDRGQETGDNALKAHPLPWVGLPKLQRLAVIALVALFIQLALGAAVRHHGAGLAIPDFPLSYGKPVPPFTQAGIEDAMIRFADKPDEYASTQHGWYTPLHVALHWSHRLWAIVAVGAAAALIIAVVKNVSRAVTKNASRAVTSSCTASEAQSRRKLTTPAIAIAVMIVLQVALGASIIWSGRHSEVATAHQTLGAIVLATTALIFFRVRLLLSHEPFATSRDRKGTVSSVREEQNHSLTVVARHAPAVSIEGAGA